VVSIALVIHTEPPLCYYRGTKPTEYALCYPDLIGLGQIQSGIRINGGSTPNVNPRIDNGAGQHTAEWTEPPLNAEASCHRDGEEIWRGVLTTVTMGRVIGVGLEA